MLRNVLLTTAIILFLINISTFAQTGKVRGKITDKTTGDLLPGSNLIFEEYSLGAAANFEGDYEIFAVPVGTQTLTVSYLGYEEQKIEVTIVENRTLELNIELTPLALEGDEVLVTAQASAQQQAINQQLTSKTIKNIAAIYVTEYYDMKIIDAKTAFFVIGSDVYGPMGKELIPFVSMADAEAFKKDHKGTRILKFEDIKPGIIKKLD